MSKKHKKLLKKAIKELARQSEVQYYEYYLPETDPHDKSYFNGLVDGINFALALLDKRAVPAPQLISTFDGEYEGKPYTLVIDEEWIDNNGNKFTVERIQGSQSLL